MILQLWVVDWLAGYEKLVLVEFKVQSGNRIAELPGNGKCV